MEIFSDGVFAIAITLLVVELPFEQVRDVAFTLLALVSPVVTLVLFTLTAGFVVWRSDYAALEQEPGADIVPPR